MSFAQAQSKDTFSNPLNESDGDDELEAGEYKGMKLDNPLAEDDDGDDDDGDKSEQDDADLE